MTIKTIRTVDDILDRVVCDLGRGVRAALRRAARGAGLMSPLAQAPQDRAKALDGGGQSRAQIARADLSRSLCGRRLERHDVAAAFLAAHERAAGMRVLGLRGHHPPDDCLGCAGITHPTIAPCASRSATSPDAAAVASKS